MANKPVKKKIFMKIKITYFQNMGQKVEISEIVYKKKILLRLFDTGLLLMFNISFG